MSNIRLAGFAFAALVATYLGVQWLMGPRPSPREVPAFHPIDVNSARYKYESSYASENDAVRDGFRRTVLDAANELDRDACNQDLKARYIDAASRYARAWLSLAPCLATDRACTASDESKLDRAQQAFSSPLDHRVREAMRRAHQGGSFQEGDFPREVVTLVAEMAADPTINPRATPQMKEIARDLRNEASCRAAAAR
jgi:hypothetical protein